MINLLPPAEKENLESDKIKKAVIIFWIILLFAAFCLFSILFSIKTYLKSQARQDPEAFNREQIARIEEFKASSNFANQSIENLNKFYKGKIYFSDILAKVFSMLPEQVYLDEISAELGENKISVSVSGYSPDRPTLLLLKENLEKDSSFGEIYFSPSNWIKPQNINFSVVFAVIPEK